MAVRGEYRNTIEAMLQRTINAGGSLRKRLKLSDNDSDSFFGHGKGKKKRGGIMAGAKKKKKGGIKAGVSAGAKKGKKRACGGKKGKVPSQLKNWHSFLMKFKRAHPNMEFSEVMHKASIAYKKM